MNFFTFFYFCGSFLSSWIQIRIQPIKINADPCHTLLMLKSLSGSGAWLRESLDERHLLHLLLTLLLLLGPPLRTLLQPQLKPKRLLKYQQAKDVKNLANNGDRVQVYKPCKCAQAIQSILLSSVADLDPSDSCVFGPPGSGYFYHQAKTKEAIIY